MSKYVSDLVVLLPCKAIEQTMLGLLPRHQSLGVRPFRFNLIPNINRDPGCLRNAHDFLRPLLRQYAHALVIFDRDGCGQEDRTREELEDSVTDRLSQSGWGERAGTVVLDPEIEVWVWSESPQVDRVLGWAGRTPDLRSWLADQGLWSSQSAKPDDPKQALRRALRHIKKTPSSALFMELAESVSLRRCIDPAFAKLRRLLQTWFPP